MSRLEFAPDTDAMEVTDISTGHFVFAPAEGKEVALARLREAIEGAGYEIDRAAIEVTGTVLDNGHIRAFGSGQVFHLGGDAAGLEKVRQHAGSDTRVTVFGRWSQAEDVQVVAVERWSAGAETPEAEGA